jgi:hypothetical protein
MVSKLFRHPLNIHSIAKFVKVTLVKKISSASQNNLGHEDVSAKNLGENSKIQFEIPMPKAQYPSQTPL